MEQQVIDNFNNILYLGHLHFINYPEYKVNFQDDTIEIFYLFRDHFDPTNLLRFYSSSFHEKIYKYTPGIYWKFVMLPDVEISNIFEGTILKFKVKVITIKNLTTYFEFLPKELLYLISKVLEATDINNFCIYMKTWEDLCTEDLYKYLYISKFNNYYNIIKDYVDVEDETWQRRYTSLLWEETPLVEDLVKRYQRMIPRNKHIKFIIDVFNFLNMHNINLKVIEKYTKDVPLFIKLLSKSGHEKRSAIINLLRQSNQRRLLEKIDIV